MGSVLEEVAATADEVADDQRRVARRARVMQRQRDRGWSWARILDRDANRDVLGLLRGGAARLAKAAGTLALGFARGLTGEGESRRRIARRLDVSHQRVTAMLQGATPPVHDGEAVR
jgi:hypothetical protein